METLESQVPMAHPKPDVCRNGIGNRLKPLKNLAFDGFGWKKLYGFGHRITAEIQNLRLSLMRFAYLRNDDISQGDVHSTGFRTWPRSSNTGGGPGSDAAKMLCMTMNQKETGI